MPSRKSSITISHKLEELINKYMALWTDPGTNSGKISRVIQEAMERLDAHYKEEWREFDNYFTEGERTLLLNNAMSTLYNTSFIEGAVIADTYDESPEIFELYNVNKEIIINKLKNLSRGSQYALVAWLEYLRSM